MARTSPRRVSLPAADDLFRPTEPTTEELASEAHVRAVPDAPADPATNTATDTGPDAPSDRSLRRRPSGRVKHDEKMTVYVTADELRVTVTDQWRSARTGAEYPAGWRIEIPDDDLVIDLTPTVADQELDTRATTGVIYWEGSQDVRATHDGVQLGGEAYVELTGYADSSSAGP